MINTSLKHRFNWLLGVPAFPTFLHLAHSLPIPDLSILHPSSSSRNRLNTPTNRAAQNGVKDAMYRRPSSRELCSDQVARDGPAQLHRQHPEFEAQGEQR